MENDIMEITPNKSITKEELIKILQQVYDNKDETHYLRLKGLSAELLAEVFKYALTQEELKDPLTTLNILNLIKIYNTLDESYFDNEDVWFDSLETLLDVKLIIHSEIKQFVKKFSIYFLSLIKSCNKVTYTPMDDNIELPQLYKSLFLSMDFMTAAGIFSTVKNINTDELYVINDAVKYLSDMMIKNCFGIQILGEFLESKQ
jgi:hypothetical protein